MSTIPDTKAEIIAKAVLNAPTQAQALRNTGFYTENTCLNHSTGIVQNDRVQLFIQRLKGPIAERCFSNIEKIANLDAMQKIAHFNKSGEKTSEATKLDPTVLRANQDLLDRAGFSKIQKHLTLKKNVDSEKDMKVLNKDIARLEAELGLQRTHKPLSTRTGDEVVVSTNDDQAVENISRASEEMKEPFFN